MSSSENTTTPAVLAVSIDSSYPHDSGEFQLQYTLMDKLRAGQDLQKILALNRREKNFTPVKKRLIQFFWSIIFLWLKFAFLTPEFIQINWPHNVKLDFCYFDETIFHIELTQSVKVILKPQSIIRRWIFYFESILWNCLQISSWSKTSTISENS